ncbi:MAG: ABC transporter permease [Flavobacteriales bacterium]|nr:ABC transporter permease [Flavobacteriales bacterium]
MKVTQRQLYNFNIAMEAVRGNGLRSFLTALGIIFGVAAVICMMAIGNGARKEVLELIEMVGANNIIILPIEREVNTEEGKGETKFSPGLRLLDANSLEESLPSARKVCPEASFDVRVSAQGKWLSTQIKGVSPDYFNLFNLETEHHRRFSQEMIDSKSAVCIIGNEVKSRLFPHSDPIGKWIKCGHVWFKVIDVLSTSHSSSGELGAMGISNFSNSVMTPVETLLLRYKNNALVTKRDFQEEESDEEEAAPKEEESTHQLSKIVVQVNESNQLAKSVEVIRTKLLQRHQGVEDFRIEVPELLLKSQEKTKKIFNLVLLAIAAISLLVGGIGIMNIMLAGVMERIREIGIRLALGATQSDIRYQFVMEAIIISVSGGVIGIILGVGLSYAVELIADITTIISVSSIVVSFAVSAAVGILFGYLPASKAAENDPVTSLRHD